MLHSPLKYGSTNGMSATVKEISTRPISVKRLQDTRADFSIFQISQSLKILPSPLVMRERKAIFLRTRRTTF